MIVWKGTILLLCGIGLYASAFMARKTARAARGELREASVVQTPRARVFGGVPNAFIGFAYYLGLALAVPFLGNGLVWDAALPAAVAAGLFSLFLAYSLLFVTRAPCVYCWASHGVNWLLVALLLAARPR